MERDYLEIVTSQKKLIELMDGKGLPMPESSLQAALARRAESTRRLLDLWGIPTLTVNYAECLRDPQEVSAQINRFLGGTLNEAAMSLAVDASQYRCR